MCISSVSFVMSSWRVRHVWMWESNAELNLSSVSSFFRCLPLKLPAFHPSSAVSWLIWLCTNVADGERGVCHVRSWCRLSSFVPERICGESTGALINYVMYIKRRQTNDDFRTFSCTWKLLFRPAFVLNGNKTLADGKLLCVTASFSWVHYINKLVCLSWRFWSDEWM